MLEEAKNIADDSPAGKVKEDGLCNAKKNLNGCERGY